MSTLGSMNGSQKAETSVRDLIDPMSPEYAQGRAAFLDGDCYTSCPHKPARKGLSPQRTNWFQGYWEARAEATAPPNLTRQAPPAGFTVAACIESNGRIKLITGSTKR